jgi:hypothetical protein
MNVLSQPCSHRTAGMACSANGTDELAKNILCVLLLTPRYCLLTPGIPVIIQGQPGNLSGAQAGVVHYLLALA